MAILQRSCRGLRGSTLARHARFSDLVLARKRADRRSTYRRKVAVPMVCVSDWRQNMSCINSFAPQNENRLANLKLWEAPRDGKRGKAGAFENVCEALRPRLLKIALRITRNREDAEDAVQDALMRTYLHIEQFRGNSAFSTWLTRILMNSALMIVRKNRSVRRGSTEDFNWSDDPD